MTRGKHAARAANRRAEATGEALSALKDKLDAERTAWQQERTDLLNEVQRLRNHMVAEIDKRVQASITDARANYDAAISAKDDQFRRRVVELLRFFTHIGARFAMEHYNQIFEILGQRQGEMFHEAGLSNSRHSKRRSHKAARSFTHAWEEAFGGTQDAGDHPGVAL